MKHVQILIITLYALLQLINRSEAHILTDSSAASQESSSAITTATEMNHIMKLVHPSEIRVPTMAEIKPYLDAAIEQEQLKLKQGDYEEHTLDEQTYDEGELEDVPNLSYTELAKILALWQVDNGKNFYDISADTQKL